ncbi:META domain-containing protein [Psychrobacter sp. LV10R520-6]|uniref:META domain-containing protein n=1 Tax=Psychrobacter sp. LV10R520-6 TaxID=1415574 RepID=UPI0024CA5EF5|nr:META domain-containing protein [Psychrobacter sp. LV10R520-6]SNT69308.1 META domain-containing protein [Psychrobacter sp. LV10R520-6]
MKPILTLALLPSLLMVSVALSACQNSSSSTENEVEAADTASETTDTTLTPNVIADEAMKAEQTAEQQMINSLARHRWTLDTATDSTSQPLSLLTTIKDQITLNFNKYQGQNTISYSVGCNTMSATYNLQGHTLTAEESMGTRMSCGDLNTAENRLNKLIYGDSQLSLVKGEKPMLTQVTGDSTTLVWKGRLTAKAKYNTKGETMFWAVSSETKPCADNGAKMCLQVKPVTYDDQGIKTSEGEWALFTGTIDGYQHDSTQEEVLRLQRYNLDTDDISEEGSDAEYAYVLDTVIENNT